ncbi:MAG TPA: PLP-dependent aminotransferase family protein, partial [Thermohalobaculum sp.]|nr:PLP-dependent aminotransferase family protein [Thermohalobaculum sp.]
HHATHGDDVIDLSTLTPVLGTIHGRRMAATLAELAGKIPEAALHSFGPSATLEPHAETAGGWLLRCGVRTRRDLILPTNGNTSAMTVALMTAVSPGDLVVTEALGHQTLKTLAGPLGLRLRGLEVDEEGVTPDAFARACRREPVKALYVMPSGLAPMAHDMGVKRREELCGIAERHGVTIIENDAWGPLRTARPAPMAAIAPERTLYFTGLTKCLLPSLRIAWLVMPETMAAAVRARRLAGNWMATALMAAIAARWLRNGTAPELLRWQRAALERRNAIAARALEGQSVRATPKGMHVWLRLPDPWREDRFAADAGRHGVAVAAGAAFAIEETERQQGVCICLGGVGEAKLRRGLDVIATLARQPPAQTHPAFDGSAYCHGTINGLTPFWRS